MKSLALKCIIALLLFTTNVNAQAPDTSTIDKLIRYVLQPIDKTQVPTSILAEYGVPLLDLPTFNGTLTDSNKVNIDIFRTLVFQMQTGYCGSTVSSLPTISSVNSAIASLTHDTLPIPVPLLIGNYNSVKSDAFTNNLLYHNTGTNQVQDVSGRSTSPYQSNNLFAAAPITENNFTGTAKFLFNNSLIWNNTGKTISSIQVDFDNALGFTSITLGTPITVSYADTGSKRWTIKVTFTDASIWQCYSSYYVAKAASSNTAARYLPGAGGRFGGGFDLFEPFGGNANHSGASVFVAYTNLNRTNTIRKPLIVVEGYDVGNFFPGFGNTYRSFILSLDDANTPTFDFNDALDMTAGYDIVYVDFNNGTDDIRRNAALLEEVIAWVNANKVPNDNNANIMEQNVVLGISMGGLVARYALAEMTKNNVETDTRLLITHDSPHQGANVPLSLQYLIRMTGGIELFGYTVRDIFPQYNQTINLLNEEASRQMLIYRSTSINTMAANTFLNGDYRNMITFASTDPQPSYEFLATSNGSECGNQLFAPYNSFINALAIARLSVILVTYKFQSTITAKALPALGSTNLITYLNVRSHLRLFGLININKDVYEETAYAPGTQLPIDGVPGGLNPFRAEIPVIRFPYAPILIASLSGNPSYFSFVPTVSALDAAPFNTAAFSQKFVNGTNPSFPSSSNNFIAQETNAGASNVSHTLFTARNANWLFDEMEGIANTRNCSNECSPDYSISGNNPICSTEVFSINGLQNGATVTWNVSPKKVVNITASGNQVSIVKTNNGLFTLTATITDACGSTNFITLTRNLTAGPLSPYISGPFDPIQNTIMNVAYVGEQYYFIASEYIPESPAPTYTWTLTPPPGSGGNVSLFSGGTIYLYFNDGEGNYTLNLTKTTSCGSNSIAIVIPVQQNYGFRISASPNPTSDVLNVTIDNETADVKALKKEENIKIDLIDFVTGTKRKSWSYKNVQNTFNLSVANLPKGQYVIRVSKGSYKQTKQIIIN